MSLIVQDMHSSSIRLSHVRQATAERDLKISFVVHFSSYKRHHMDILCVGT